MKAVKGLKTKMTKYQSNDCYLRLLIYVFNVFYCSYTLSVLFLSASVLKTLIDCLDFRSLS